MRYSGGKLASNLQAVLSHERLMYYFFVFLLVSLLLITQNYPDLEYTLQHGFSDQSAYVAIAVCQLHNNCHELYGFFSGHWLQRWAPNIIVGTLADLSGIDLWVAYRIGILTLILISAIAIEKLHVSLWNKLAYFSFVIFFPYGFRLFLFAPAMIADASFYLSILILFVGLQTKDENLIYSSIIICCFSRQTSVMLIPIFFGLGFFKSISFSQVFRFSAMTVIVLYTYLLMLKFSFNISSESALKHLYFWQLWSRDGLLDALFPFVGRFSLYFLLISPAFLLNCDKKEVLISSLCVALIAAQPLLSGPFVTGNNITRLVAYATPFLGGMFINKDQKKSRLIIFIFFMIFESFNFNYYFLLDKYSYGFLIFGMCLAVLATKYKENWVLAK